jgi:CDP-glucose 4,6-dehydratase
VEDLVTSTANPIQDFWRGKRVLLIGHTGFKGSWLALLLDRLGASVTGISLPPATTPNLFTLAGIGSIAASHFSDIRDVTTLAALIETTRTDSLFHLAAKPLVRASYREPLATFATNIQGTANALDAVRSLDAIRVVVAITTDKVHKNVEQPSPYRETDPLGGHDPYSVSKAAAESVISSYRDSYLAERNVAVASARARNVIGGRDWSEDRLIPDAIRAWNASQPLQVPRSVAIRPWQHVLDPLSGYLRLAEHLWRQPSSAGAYNFGPESTEAATVREVVQFAQSAYGKGQVVWGDGSEGQHEAGWLALEISKARTALGFSPRWSLADAVLRTMRWCRAQHDGAEVRTLCEADIEAYETAQESGHRA